jgi:AraC-like DNA-binding protein
MLLWISPWTAFRCWLPGDKPVSFYRFRLRVENRRGETLYRRDAPLLIRGIGPARRWFEEIVRATDQDARSLRSWRIRAALIGLFAEAQSSKAAPAPSGRLRPRQREALEEWVRRDGKVQVTPARLAARLGLSADYFTRLFRKTYGISPRAWIVRERIKMAAVRLLESHLNVGEVAGNSATGTSFSSAASSSRSWGKARSIIAAGRTFPGPSPDCNKFRIGFPLEFSRRTAHCR